MLVSTTTSAGAAHLPDGVIRPCFAERITFDQLVDAQRRIEAGGPQGKLVLCPGG